MLLAVEQRERALGLVQQHLAAAPDSPVAHFLLALCRSDVPAAALAHVEDALGLGQAKVDTAYTGMTAAIDVVDEIKTKLVAAREPGVDKTKIQSEIKELQGQLTSIASSASFSGENWLSIGTGITAGTKNVVASFNRAADGTVSVGTIGVDTTKPIHAA